MLLVHAEHAEKSACSLVVNVGSFDDPVQRPGFAHFIEHLLFTGNQAYPTPLALNQFVSQHGGHANAWTATEHSNFHFDIKHNYFESALAMFSQQFVEPLFSEEAIKQEQNAIHAEFNLKLKDDSRRIQQVHKETVNNDHPFHKFSVGNRQTLADLPGRPVRNELIQFWQQYYQGQYMSLCIVSPMPLDAQEKLVTELFTSIPGSLNATKKPNISASLYQAKDLACFIKIKPVKELHKFNIGFALPGIDEWYRSKMVSFIAHIIGYEGPGSLYENLKQQGFINALAAGNGISGSNFKDFNISLELTDLGEQQIDVIVAEVCHYLRFLQQQSLPDYLYEEQQLLSQIGFQYKEEVKPLKQANSLALNMHHYQDEDIVYGDYRMDGFDANLWQFIFSLLVPSNMRLTLVSQNVECDQQAHWYHTEYQVSPFTEQQKRLFVDFSSPYYYLLPKANPYLPESIHIEAADFNNSVPVCLQESKNWQTWFKQDISFRVPKGNIYLGMDLPNAVKDLRHQAMARLLCDLFMDTVSETHYQAEMAGLYYNLYAHNAGITLYTSGLSPFQDKLVLNLLDNLLNFSVQLSRFLEVKRQLIKHWRNSESNKPISQLFSELNHQLMPSTGSNAQLADILENLSIAEFNRFVETIFSQVHAEILIYGNWNSKQAVAINEKLKSAFNNTQLVDELPRELLLLTPDSCITQDKLVNHPDHAALIYYQGLNRDDRPDIIETAYFVLTSQILAPHSFDYLRTQQQLGYMAGSGYMPLRSLPGVAVYVQSSDYCADVLVEKLKSCMQTFIDELTEMATDEFDYHKQAVIHQYLETPKNLNQKSQQLWLSLGQKDYMFNLKQLIANELANIQLQDLIRWAKSKFIASPAMMIFTTKENN